MTLHVKRYNGDKAEWDGYVRSHPDSTNYHQIGWKEVIEESFGHKSFYLMATDETGRIRGVLPLVHMKSAVFGSFIVSVPFFNYGGLLCDDAAAGGALLDEARNIQEDVGAEFIELRHFRGGVQGLAVKQHKVTMLLALEKDTDAQWKVMQSKLRNQVRKAMKSGFVAKTGGIELIDDFYLVFSRNMRDLGTPVYSKVFFLNVLKIFQDSARVFTICMEGKTVAAGIAVWYKDTIEVPWASSLKEFRTLCPNNLLYWEAISYAIENGFSNFDFGRSTPGEGTYKYKEQWGAQPVQLSWQYLVKGNGALPELNPDNPKFRFAIKVWQRLPVSLTRLVGPMIVKNIP